MFTAEYFVYVGIFVAVFLYFCMQSMLAHCADILECFDTPKSSYVYVCVEVYIMATKVSVTI